MRISKIYLTNKELLAEIIQCKKNNKISDKLGNMFILMVDKYGTKSNFAGYSYLEEMKGSALYQLCRYWDKFDETKSSNPFAFYTQIIHNQFLQELNYEKNQQKIRDTVLMLEGYNTSFSFQEDYNEEREMIIEELQTEVIE